MACLSNFLRITVPVRLFITLSLLFTGLVFARPALSWEVCNETSFILRVSTVTSVDGQLSAQGWTKAWPGQCLPFSAPDGGPRYIYAESSAAHQGGLREWKGTHNFCTAAEDFTARTDISCALQGVDSRDYISVDPREQKTIFTEPRNYGAKAVTAGLQRLLQDNGYNTPTIDGLAGRQTARDISAFLRSKELSISLPDAEKLVALEAAALELKSEIGIHACNQIGKRVWVATAYRFGASWESRGWWPVEPQACAHVHTSSIKNIDAHLFALLEADDGGPDLILKSNAAVPAQFCIAESRFSATDRESCASRGYSAASFRPLPAAQDGVTVNLTAADFTDKNIGGLRQ